MSATEHVPEFRLKIIGNVEVHSADGILAIRNRKLLALAALAGGLGRSLLSRDEVIGKLWSEVPDEKAKASLRNLLYLQKDISPDGSLRLFDSQQSSIRYLGDPSLSDLEQLLSAARDGDVNALGSISLQNFEHELLGGLDGIDPSFDDWLAEVRGHITERLIQRLQRCLGDEAAPCETKRVVAIRLSELKPEHEPATRYLMRLDAAAGNTGDALRRYEALWHVLEDRFDVEPSSATSDLAIALKMPPTEAATVAVHSNEPQATIFIRKFATGDVGGAEFFVAGIRAELLDALFAVEEWIIVEPDDDELFVRGAGYFELRGVVAPGLSKTRLILTLKDLSSGRVVWNEQIPLDMEGWAENSMLAVQRLASLLVTSVESERFDQISRLEPKDLSDFDRVTRARVLMYDWDIRKDREAEALLRSVLDSPRIGIRGRIGLVELLNSRHIVFPGTKEPEGQRAEAIDLARECVRSGRYKSDAQLCLAWAALQAGELEEAITAADSAADMSTSNPRRLAAAAEVLGLAGEVGAGLRFARLSEQLDLGTSRVNHGYRVSIFFAAGEHGKCLSAATRSDGAIILGDGYAAAAAVEMGDMDSALKYWRRFQERLASAWCGADPLGREDARPWFIAASPARTGKMRERFEAALKKLPDT